jgi:hypothetical protein
MKIEKKRLYLDDVRTPVSEDWIWVKVLWLNTTQMLKIITS